jgi:hypothetical protein
MPHLPPEFFPLPSPPSGYNSWAYRGEAWINLNRTVYAWRTKRGEWIHGSSANVYGMAGQYFLEAI